MTNRIHLSYPIYLFEFSRPLQSHTPAHLRTKHKRFSRDRIDPVMVVVILNLSGNFKKCGCNSGVECQLPKLDVVGSNPTSRSTPSDA